MNYKTWFNEHRIKHKNIVNKLNDLTNDEIIEYFKFENMIINEPNFCPLYKESKKCHNIENLNCYLCACPNFRFNDDGLSISNNITLYSKCSIDSKDGSQFKNDDSIHQDCSKCRVPHEENYISKVFSRDWFEVMKKTCCIQYFVILLI